MTHGSAQWVSGRATVSGTGNGGISGAKSTHPEAVRNILYTAFFAKAHTCKPVALRGDGCQQQRQAIARSQRAGGRVHCFGLIHS